ncbi:TrkH family potassium uptake protein [Oceanobacter antarcticus]|uniref:Trk system potassium uptake protein n=1 Tax=Oceanobacter antarcticus TaxID=3133425 RepID=A0ABW8NG85_9GAMM
MIDARVTTRLMAMPVLWMGSVQMVFGGLSVALFRDDVARVFLEPGLAMLLGGGVLFWKMRRTNLALASYQDALFYAVATWVVTGLLGALPILYIEHVSFADAVFESVSALTTTGATVLSGLDNMPLTFLLYRQFLQWMGGLGIVIFVVAVLPMLNVGGMRLLKAETPGPMKNDKLSPRIADTARHLWGVYITATLACALCYWLGGMTVFDAFAHSLATVSTGGFSTHDASMGYFDSQLLLAIADVFMLVGAISFAVHFRAVHRADLKVYWVDEETRIFLLIVICLSLILTAYLLATEVFTDVLECLGRSFFHVISFITSTGFAADDFVSWPAAAGFLLVFSGYLGGCSGSTAGGNKIIRNILTIKLVNQAMGHILHPRSIYTLKYQRRPVAEDVQGSVMGFMSFAAASSAVLTLMMMATGLNFWSAFTAVAACINVLGPGFDQVGANFKPVSDAGKWILSGAMILGRLEYFTVFALLSPRLWRA